MHLRTRGALKASRVGEKLVSRAESREQSHGDKEGTELCTMELQGRKATDKTARLPKQWETVCGRQRWMDTGISGLIKMHLQPGVSTGWALPGSASTCLCEPEPWDTQCITHHPAGKAGVLVLPAQEKVLNHPNPQPGTFIQPLCSKWGSALDLPINHSWVKWIYGVQCENCDSD